MTWTKGNHKGEWVARTFTYNDGTKTIDEIKGRREQVARPELVLKIPVIIIPNESDRRLIELAPRMAEAILDIVYRMSENKEEIITENNFDLVMELRQLKAGTDE